MRPQEIAARLQLPSFAQEQNLEKLMKYDKQRPHAYACGDNGQVIGLNLRSLGLTDEQAAFIWELKGLQALNLSENQLSAAGLPEMSALRYLNLSENKNLRTLTFGGELPKLEWVELSECALEELTLPDGCEQLRSLYVQKNKLRRLVFKGECPELELLDAGENQLAAFTLPKGFPRLACLYLNNNRLSTFEPISSLPALDTLHLNNNQMKSFTAGHLRKIPNVQLLKLDNNPLPSALQASIGGNFGERLQGLQAYHRDLAKGAGLDNEYKVLLIGNGGVGKTCLVEKLTTGKFREKWESTDGISLRQYEKLEGYVLNLWDFGGQDIYHATHRLFMQSRAIYLVLWDPKTEADPSTGREEGGQVQEWDNQPLSYWLDYVQHFGEGSPAIVVQTKMKQFGKQVHPNQANLREKYDKAFSLDFLHIDSRPDDPHENGFRKLLGAVEDAIHSLKQDDSIPLNWMSLRQAIRQKQENLKALEDKTLSLQDYLELAAGANIDIENPMNALRWLTESGVVFYQKGLFRDRIILDQKWFIDAVYAVLKRGGEVNVYNHFLEKKGRFTGKDLAEIAWPKNTPAEQELFLKFMLSCELCFEITEREEENWRHVPFEEREFLAPELLGNKKPPIVDVVEDYWEKDEMRRVLYVRYRHNFLHRGVIQRFIVRTHKLAKVADIWRNGILLKENKENVIVESPAGRDEILLKAQESGKALLDKTRQLLEKLQEGKGTESVSLDGRIFVGLKKLQDCQGDYLAGEEEEREKVVRKADYAVFLSQEEKAPAGRELPGSMPLKHHTMHGAEKEIEGLKETLNLLIKKKTFFAKELVKAHDAAQKFALETGIEQLETEIAEYRQQMETLAARIPGKSGEAPAGAGIESLRSQAVQLQQEAAAMSQQLKPPARQDEHLKILFLTANPATTTRISWQKEHTHISIEISSGNQLIPKTAVTIKEMIDAVADHSPDIVHFCGHGQEEDVQEALPAGLAFQNEDKNAPEVIGADQLRNIFRRLKRKHPQLKAVLFNACYSAEQARAISELGIYAVGTSDKIQSLAARHFAAGFYRTYQKGQDVIAAIDHGITQGINYDEDIERMVKLYYNGKHIDIEI